MPLAHLVLVAFVTTASTGCSLLFDQAPHSDGGHAAMLDSALVPDDDAMGPTLPFADDFEAIAIDERWLKNFDNGDLCILSDDKAKTGAQALHCTSDNTTGTKAELILSFPDTSTITVEMDVLFARKPPASNPPTWLTFLQPRLRSDDGITQNMPASSFYASGKIDIFDFTDDEDQYVDTAIEGDVPSLVNFR